MNLIFSYGINEDLEFNRAGHLFLGAAEDAANSEVHVWLKRDCEFPEAHMLKMFYVLRDKLGFAVCDMCENPGTIFPEKIKGKNPGGFFPEKIFWTL